MTDLVGRWHILESHFQMTSSNQWRTTPIEHEHALLMIL